jgi:dihydrofolate reductase
MGRSTYETMSRPLPERLNVVMTHHPPQTVPAGVEFTSDPPRRILERLGERGYSTVAVTGGAQVYRAFLEAGLVDELWLTIEPLAFGEGIGLFGDATLAQRFTLLEVQRLNASSLHLRYSVDERQVGG